MKRFGLLLQVPWEIPEKLRRELSRLDSKQNTTLVDSPSQHASRVVGQFGANRYAEGVLRFRAKLTTTREP